MRTLLPDQSQATVAEFEGLQFEVPAGAADQEITISRGEDNLVGIRKPYGFQAVGLPYRFGPHELKFKKSKSLKPDCGLTPP